MLKVLITGGVGFIGSHLVKSMLDKGHDVFVLDSFTQFISPPVDNLYVYNVNWRFENLLPGAEIRRGNIVNKDELRRQVIDIKPNLIIHLAALPLADMAIEYSEETFTTIVGGTINFMEILRDVDFLDRFVYISSSMIYGDFEKIPISEEDRKEPKEIYGGMKIAGEHMVKVYSQRYDIPYSIVRPSAVYGPTDNNKRVVDTFLSNAMLGKPIRVKNAEKTVLDFTFVEDVVEGIKRVSVSGSAKNETFNITRGRGRSLKELVNVILTLFPNTRVEYTNGDSFRPQRGALDISKARQQVGFNPAIDIEEGVPKYSEYLMEAMKRCRVKYRRVIHHQKPSIRPLPVGIESSLQ